MATGEVCKAVNDYQIDDYLTGTQPATHYTKLPDEVVAPLKNAIKDLIINHFAIYHWNKKKKYIHFTLVFRLRRNYRHN